MSIIPKNAVCDTLKSEYNIISKVYKGKNKAMNKALKVRSDIDKMTRKLKKSILTPFDTLDDKLLDIKNKMDSKLPNPSDVKEIVDIMKNCAFFDVEDDVSSTMNFYNKSCNYIRDEIYSMGDSLSDSIPEFDFFSKMGNLKTKGDSENLKKLDQIIECINSICGPSYLDELSEMVEEVNGIYEKMGIDDDPSSENYGEISLDKISQESGADLSGIDKINNMFKSFDSTISENKENSKTSIISEYIL